MEDIKEGSGNKISSLLQEKATQAYLMLLPDNLSRVCRIGHTRIHGVKFSSFYSVRIGQDCRVIEEIWTLSSTQSL
jgi:hypothetical protein